MGKPGHSSKRNEIAEVIVFRALEAGLEYTTAAKLAGVTPRTLRNWREDEQFSLACEKAVAGGKMSMTAKLVKAANGGNVTAMIFWLKTHMVEFREKSTIENPDEVAKSLVQQLREAASQMDDTVPGAA